MISNHKTKNFLLKLYITNNCNKECKHCSLNNYEYEPLIFEKFKSIIEDYIKILKKSSETYNCKYKGHIMITGEDPFLRNDFYTLLSLLYRYREFITYSVASNGASITDETCFKLKAFNVSSVQLPLEGSREIHDKIRFKGSFDTIINALDILHKNKIKSNVIFTASKENYKKFPKVCKICKVHNVSNIFAEKFIPSNKAETLSYNKCLNENECKIYYKMIKIQQIMYHFNLLTNIKINSCSSVEDKNVLTFNYCDNIKNSSYALKM